MEIFFDKFRISFENLKPFEKKTCHPTNFQYSIITYWDTTSTFSLLLLLRPARKHLFFLLLKCLGKSRAELFI